MKHVACPFYGFNLFVIGDNPLMMAQNGNQCALVLTAYSPCIYREDPQGPDWFSCRKRWEPETTELINDIREDLQVFPTFTANQSIPFKVWEERVLSGRSSL